MLIEEWLLNFSENFYVLADDHETLGIIHNSALNGKAFLMIFALTCALQVEAEPFFH